MLTVGAADAEVVKIATLSPDGSPWMKEMRAAGAELERATEGRVVLKFYPGGVMGDDKAVLRKMRIGQLQGAMLTGGSLTNAYTDVQLYNLPMVFRSLEEVDFVRARMDPRLVDGLAAGGFRSLGFVELGFAYAMSTTPGTSVAAARALKVWAPDGDPGSANTLEAFAITPIPLTIADVLAGLQTGLINAVAIPPVGAVALQWHTQLDYVLDLPLVYVFGTLVVDERTFDKLSEEDQSATTRIVGKTVRALDKRARRDHEQSLAALAKQGIKMLEPSPAEVAEWQTFADAGTKRLVERGVVTPEGFDALMRILAEHRGSGAR
jgi:TRAP-type C4-dicarboxylate transport system substrate-binding protein